MSFSDITHFTAYTNTQFTNSLLFTTDISKWFYANWELKWHYYSYFTAHKKEIPAKD